MTMTEESPIKALPLFGPITIDDMRKNDIVGKLAMKRVGKCASYRRAVTRSRR